MKIRIAEKMKKTLLTIIALVGLICASCTSSNPSSTKSDTETLDSADNSVELTRFSSSDLAFFALYGHVKSVTEDGIVSLEFDQNGTLTSVYGSPASQRYSRDNQGRIVEMNGYENHVTYTWGDERPVGSEAQAEGMTSKETYTYDERGFVAQISHSDDGEESIETFTYSDFDKHGNWTKRVSEGYEYTAGNTSRVIEYYE